MAGVSLNSEAGHILYLRILYPIHIQAPKKVYPISFVKFFASIVTVSKQQKARPGKVGVFLV
jgi:hypothetical protein